MFDVGLIQWLQSFSTPALDTFFQMFTHLGSHYAYMLIIPFVYWAIDRDVGRRLGGLFMASMWLNGLVKEYMILPRPDPELVRVMADEPSPGFPSGHAQGAITLWGYMAIALRQRWLSWLAAALIVLLPVSRLYLGVHFPADIVGGLTIGAVLILIVVTATGLQIGSGLSVRMRMLLVFLIPLLLYPLYQTGTSEQLIGFFIGFFTADILGGRLVPFQPRVSIGQQVAKLLIGYVGFAGLIVLHMLYVPVGLPAVFGYSLIGIWIAILAPALFRTLGLDGYAPVRRLDARWRQYVQHYTATAIVVVLFVVGSAVYVNRAVPVIAQPSVLHSDGDVLVIAHRGGAGLAPENTLVGFETGLSFGADVLEMDVWRTRDGEIVVIHDATVNRTTDGTGRVGDLTLAEIQALDAGYRFTRDRGETYPWRGKGVFIPTLEQVLTAFPDERFVIELKERDATLADDAVALIDALGMRDQVVLASFHDEVIQRVRDIAPDITTSMGQGEATRYVLLQKLGLGAFLNPVAPAMQLPEWQSVIRVTTPGLARLARRQGVELHVWTINSEEAMHRVIALGANGVMTDYPDRLQRVLSTYDGRDLEQIFY